ncbi:hypothetical protein BJY24_001851 [Nocardia transvalensis]|uniref:SAV-6107-like HEPN domain-containing protein n=1 Tax=Nocardia transvalensis TaxID=37333 RepID=A0A7W9PBF7_9NOCA|nr:hypothetical protein [Nocardia transvalensis]MBB5912984.1 hypothetical protein [Nocardia transvalensis]
MDQSLIPVADRLRSVDTLITNANTDLAGMWPRACAWLLRIALERAVRELWSTVSPPMTHVTLRAQFLVVQKYIGPEAAADARLLWSQLSATSHHHDHQPAPSAAELRRWHDTAEHIIEAIDAAIRRHRAHDATPPD